MELSPKDCDIQETCTPGKTYSCSLEYKGKMAAILYLLPREGLEINGEIFEGLDLAGFMVFDEFRGNGLASYMIDRATGCAGKNKFNIILDRLPKDELKGLTQEQLRPFYERHGLEEIAKNVFYYAP